LAIFEKAELLQNKNLNPVENLLTHLSNKLGSVADLIKSLNELILNKNIGELDSSFYSLNKDLLNLNLTDENKFKINLMKVENNLKFNLFIIYLLSLEMLIEILYNKISYNSKLGNIKYLNILEKVLFTALQNYIISILLYNKDYLGLESDNLKLDISSNFPLPTNLDKQSYCGCDQINNNSLK
jgi:hypothetical protein